MFYMHFVNANRCIAELDVLFENKVSARKFRKVEVDPWRSDNLVVVNEEDASSQEFADKKI